MAEPQEPAFDPARVPPFPVLTLHLDEDAERVSLDGAPVEPAPGQTLRDAGIAAVVRQLDARELEAVRVRVTTPGEEEWRMVVTADGEVFDTTPNQDEATKTTTRRRMLLGGGALALLGITGAGAAVALPRVLAPKAPPAWQVPGADTQISVAAPPGFAGTARWAVPVGKNTDVCVLSSGHVGTVSDDGVLTLRHPDTAQPQWSGASAPDSINTARRISWDGTDAIAVTTPTQLSVWPLGATGPEGAPAPATTHKLEQGWRAELAGPAPFIELADWFVDVPTAQLGTRRITIPAGTRAALREQNGTLHVIGPGRIHHLDAEGRKLGEHALTLPKPPAQMPTGVWAISDQLVLTAWEAKGTRLTLIRPADAAVLLDTTVPDRLDQRARTRTLGAGMWMIGTTLVDTGAAPFARTLGSSFAATAAHGRTAYGTANRAPATLEARPDSAPTPWPTFTAEDVPPRAVTDSAAFIITPTLKQTILYAAPRT